MTAPRSKFHIWRQSRRQLGGLPYEWIVQQPVFWEWPWRGKTSRQAFDTFDEARAWVARDLGAA